MIDAKKLIEMNNTKRKQLTKENEKYYSDLLLYIRSVFGPSEQKTEEILMEILDHLLEGQKEGKTAHEIFGNNPKEYADEIISLLPKENIRNRAKFATYLILNMLGSLLFFWGIIFFIASQFKEVDNQFYIFKMAICLLVTIGATFILIHYIFRVVNQSIFPDKKNDKKNFIKVGFAGMLACVIIICAFRFTPDFGPKITINWYIYVMIGFVIWLVSKLIERK